MSDVQVILYGYVGQEVTFKKTGRGDLATFRVGTTPRVRDGRGGFRDGETVWTSITCWRNLAQNVNASVHVGDPVVVIGRARTQRWVTEQGEQRERSFVDATTVCHDLAKGTSAFRKGPRTVAVPDDADALGDALEESENSPVGVDPATGEALYPLGSAPARSTGQPDAGAPQAAGAPGDPAADDPAGQRTDPDHRAA